MADDTIAYLETVVAVSQAGAPRIWSDGATAPWSACWWHCAVRTSWQRLVLIGQYYNSSGKVAGGLTDEGLELDSDAIKFLRTEYDQVSPDGPEHFPIVYAKTDADASDRAGDRPVDPRRASRLRHSCCRAIATRSPSSTACW